MFKADWCSPCKSLESYFPIYAQNGKGWNVYTLDIEDDLLSEIADSYDVKALPFLMIIKSGQVIKAQIGAG